MASNLRWVRDMKENANNPSTIAKRINHNKVLQIDTTSGKLMHEWENAYTAAAQLKLLNKPSRSATF